MAKKISLLAPEKKLYYNYEDYDIEDLLTYAGIDCLVTSNLATALSPHIFSTPTYSEFRGGEAKEETEVILPSIVETYEKYTTPAFNLILDMEVNGIKYDVNLNRELDAQMRSEIQALEMVIKAEVGNDLNLDSGDEVAKYLYEVRGFTAEKLTKTGEPSTDGEAILALYKTTGENWLKTLAKRNDIASTWRTFIKDYCKFVKRDGRIHPSYNLHGTSSFRISGDNPNLTQLPRAKHGYNVRRCFRVEDGYIFLTLDFSSAEVKVLGALCKDPLLLKAIREGLDFHSFSASQMYSINYDEFVAVLSDESHEEYRKYKELRQFAKALTFGILYGSSPRGIANTLGITLEEAERIISLYFNTYPGIEEFVTNAHSMALYNHYVVSVFGFRKMQYGTLPPFKYTAVYNGGLRNSQNVLVQSPTSSAGLFAFGLVNDAIKALGGRTMCTVYDSIELEIPRQHAAEALEIAFHCMDDLPVEIFDWLDLPIGSDAEIGFNWGEVKHVHRGATQEEIEVILQELERV